MRTIEILESQKTLEQQQHVGVQHTQIERNDSELHARKLYLDFSEFSNEKQHRPCTHATLNDLIFDFVFNTKQVSIN